MQRAMWKSAKGTRSAKGQIEQSTLLDPLVKKLIQNLCVIELSYNPRKNYK